MLSSVTPDSLCSFIQDVPKGEKWSSKLNPTAEVLERCLLRVMMNGCYGRSRYAEIVQPSADIFTLVKNVAVFFTLELTHPAPSWVNVVCAR